MQGESMSLSVSFCVCVYVRKKDNYHSCLQFFYRWSGFVSASVEHVLEIEKRGPCSSAFSWCETHVKLSSACNGLAVHVSPLNVCTRIYMDRGNPCIWLRLLEKLPCISRRVSTWRGRWPWGPCTWPCTRSNSDPRSSCPACSGTRDDERAAHCPGKLQG